MLLVIATSTTAIAFFNVNSLLNTHFPINVLLEVQSNKKNIKNSGNLSLPSK